tara:strand:- start:129 stop:398 length:270 start_codon:yes stop_codon:yes gene_type:complete
MWPYDRNVSIALGVGTVVSAVACYYMYNNESGGGAAAASATVAAADGVKAVNNVESKAWDISRFFGLGKALATSVGGKVAEANKILSSP